MIQQVTSFWSTPRLSISTSCTKHSGIRLFLLLALFCGMATAVDAGVTGSFIFPGDSTISATICGNENYPFNGQLLNETGEYTAVYEASDGSDSIVTLQLTVLPVSENTIVATICSGETYPFNGQDLDESGEYQAVLTAENGCDSTVTLQLTVLPVSAVTLNVSICSGETYPFFGLNLDMSGEYEAVLPAENGCDSTVTLQLSVLPNPRTNISAAICAGTGYIFQGDTLTESGTFTGIETAENGCDSIIILKLDVVEYFDIHQTAVVCNGETYTFGDTILADSGVYVDSLQAIGGCDSTVTLTLTVLPALGSTITVNICEGSSYIFHGDTLTEEGTYVYNETGTNGCDSLVQFNLDLVPFFETTVVATICEGDTYTLGTQLLTAEGVYSEVFTAIGGCDSTVTVELTVLPKSSGTDGATICEGTTYTYHGEEISAAGDYEFVLESAAGCDSIVLFTLTVLESPETKIEAAVCAGESFFFYGQNLSESGSYDQVFEAENGCDSTITLLLTVLPELGSELEASVCAGASYDFNGEILTESGVYKQILSSELGCDSTVTLTLTVLPAQSSTLDVVVCAGETYEFNGEVLDSSNTYTAVFPDINGCDSTVTLNLTVLPLKASDVVAVICEGQTYEFNGEVLTETGVYTVVLPGEFGCDSIVQLDLNVLPTASTSIDATICEGSSYNYYGQQLTDAGSYEFTFTAENGCDSTVTVNISVTPLTYGSTEVAICAGQSYDYNGESLTETGVYNFPFPGANGCDSIFIVYLTVYPTYTSELNESVCEGSTYDFYGTPLVTSGSYIKEFTSVNGCDSTITLNLTFVTGFESTKEATVCAGESYIFDQDTLTESGEYTQTYVSAGGCDSVVTLILTVLPESGSTADVNICAGASYDFNGEVLTETGTYTAVVSNSNGCDSTIVLNLTVLPIATSSSEATICAGESYPFYGEILKETGVYTAVLTSVNGCDSIVQLSLDVLPVSTGSEAATICAGETYAFNGQVLSETGIYTAIYAAANGCDSTVTLTLTVTPLPQSVFASVVCGGGSFEFNGEVLTESGAYTFLLDGAAVNGCDSLVTLFLTIFPIIPPTTVSAAICAGESYEIDGESLTASGTYTFNLSSATGCDSIVVVNLTVNPASASAISATICAGASYEFNGQILTQPGVYTATLQNYLGCDSVVTLTLAQDVVSVTVTLNNGELTATATGVTFQWINCNGNVPISGATGSSFTPTATGNYAVIVTNASGCTAVSSCTNVVVVSVRDLLSANGWSLQPNPASSQTTVVLKEALTTDVALEVFDPAGRLLHQQHIAAGANQVSLDVSNFPDGMLMIRLMSSEGVSSKLLMKGN